MARAIKYTSRALFFWLVAAGITPASVGASQERAPRPREICGTVSGGKKLGGNLLVVVNKRRRHRLASDWEPSDLVAIPRRYMMPEREGQIRRKALRPLKKMLKAARRRGFRLGVRSAYRSFHTQCITYESKIRRYGRKHAARYSAKPGHSQHQLGTTVDISSPRLNWELTGKLAKRRDGRWLAKNSWRYGFVLSYPKNRERATGYAFEPWHFRYVGKEIAKKIFASGLVPDGYLSACTGKKRPGKCRSKKRQKKLAKVKRRKNRKKKRFF